MVKDLFSYMKFRKRDVNLNFLFAHVVYSDDKSLKNVDKHILKSDFYKIQGKPDYIFKTIFGNYIPVEIKSSNIKESYYPRENEAMQLITYFFLVQDNYGKCKKGYLVYNDKMFIIKNNSKVRGYFLKELNKMKKMINHGRGVCEPSFVKCRYCICRGTVCEFCD
ncbi:MAG: hypothetical protein ACK5LV_00075 [Lachnospirales bacterium]